MLDDSALAWGTRHDDQNIEVTKTQTLPGVGRTDDGKSLVDLALASHLRSDNIDAANLVFTLGA